MEKPSSSDSVDLLKLAANLADLLAKNMRMALVTLVLCLLAGVLYAVFAPRVYESKMIIQSDILSESYSLKVAENLNRHIIDGDFEFLASSFALPLDDVTKLRELKLVSALSPTSQQMQEKDKIIVVISVRVTDNTILPRLQGGILHYFTDNEYVKKRVEEKKKELERYIAAIDRELKMMDTVKMKIHRGQFVAAKAGEVSFIDISGLYQVAGDLYQKKFEAMSDLAIVDSIQVIENFTPYAKPAWPKKSVVMLASVVLAGIIIFSILTLRSIRNQLAPKV